MSAAKTESTASRPYRTLITNKAVDLRWLYSWPMYTSVSFLYIYIQGTRTQRACGDEDLLVLLVHLRVALKCFGLSSRAE